MPSFTSDGLDLNYIDEGEGDPVLLVHGFASSLAVNWQSTNWVTALRNDGRRVVAFDHRGHGKSQKVYEPAAYGLDSLAGDALRLLDHLAIPRADILGYSMGARVGAFIAVTQPERVRSLVIGGMGDRLFGGAPKAAEIAEALEAPSRDHVTDAYARSFRAFADATGGDLKALAAVMRSPRMPLPPEMVGRIACPTLIAVGSLDDVSGSAYELAAHIPGAEVLDIPGRDHNRAVGDRVFKEGVLAFLSRRP